MRANRRLKFIEMTYLLVDLRERVHKDDRLLDVQVLDRTVFVVRLDALHVGEGVQSADQLPEHGVLPVEVFAGAVRDKTGMKMVVIYKTLPGNDSTFLAHNCDLLVLGPEFAMLRIPRPVCERCCWISSLKGVPQKDSPPVPSPFGSPP